MAALLASCLAKDPARRPAAAEVAQRLRAHPAIPERLSDVRPPQAATAAMAPTLPPGATTPRTTLAPTEPTSIPTPATRRGGRWPYLVAALLTLAVLGWLALRLLPDRESERAAVRRLAEIGQVAEARAGITKLVQEDPAQPVEDLVRDVDLAEARQLWRIGRQKQALVAYDELIGRHRGDPVAGHAVVAELPTYEPVVLRAVLSLPSLATAKEAAVAWRWLSRGNRVADDYPVLVGLLAAWPQGPDEARKRLADADESERNGGIDVLEKAGVASDADRIRYHSEQLVRLGAGDGQAATSVAWLAAESAKPGWHARKAAAVLPAFTDVAALHRDDDHSQAVERLLIAAFAAEVRPQIEAWIRQPDTDLATHARRIQTALAQTPGVPAPVR